MKVQEWHRLSSGDHEVQEISCQKSKKETRRPRGGKRVSGGKALHLIEEEKRGEQVVPKT